MTYKECCNRLGEKLSEYGLLVGTNPFVLPEACVEALRSNSANGKLEEDALVEHLPKPSGDPIDMES
jgi:hypothetical protein